MDKEDFQAWKDSPLTEWVFLRLSQIADRVESGLKDRLYQSTHLPPSQWAEIQSQAQADVQYVRAIREITNLELEDIDDQPERDTADRA